MKNLTYAQPILGHSRDSSLPPVAQNDKLDRNLVVILGTVLVELT